MRRSSSPSRRAPRAAGWLPPTTRSTHASSTPTSCPSWRSRPPATPPLGYVPALSRRGPRTRRSRARCAAPRRSHQPSRGCPFVVTADRAGGANLRGMPWPHGHKITLGGSRCCLARAVSDLPAVRRGYDRSSAPVSPQPSPCRVGEDADTSATTRTDRVVREFARTRVRHSRPVHAGPGFRSGLVARRCGASDRHRGDEHGAASRPSTPGTVSRSRRADYRDAQEGGLRGR